MPQHKYDDAIVQFDVGADVENFQQVLAMYGSQSMQYEETLRFFLAKAVMHISGRTPSFNIMNDVIDRIKREMKNEYGMIDMSRQEKNITDEWIQLVDSIKANIRQYLYDNDYRNNKIATFRQYMGNGIISVILHDDDDEV